MATLKPAERQVLSQRGIHMLLGRSIVTWLVALLFTSSALATEPRPLSGEDALLFQEQQQINFAWQEGDFATLDKVAEQYRTKMQRTESGKLLLFNFYQGFLMAFAVSTDQSEVAWTFWQEQRDKWMQQYPLSPTPLIAHSLILESLAWDARGRGFANTVFDENWTKFKSHLRDWLEFLKKHEQVASTDPTYWDHRATAEFLLHNDHDLLDKFLLEGIKRFPKYTGYYFTGAHFSKAIWGGETSRYHSWLKRAAESAQDGRGTGLLAHVYLKSHGGPLEYAEIANKGPLWPMVKTAIEDELKRYPHYENARRLSSLACFAHDAEMVERLRAFVRKAVDAVTPSNSSAEYCKWDAQQEPPKQAD